MNLNILTADMSDGYMPGAIVFARIWYGTIHVASCLTMCIAAALLPAYEKPAPGLRLYAPMLLVAINWLCMP